MTRHRRPRVHRYRVAGVRIRSSIPFPELAPAPGGGADLVIVRAGAGPAGAPPPRWRTVTRDGRGRPWMESARRGADVLLRFGGLAEFAIGGRGRRIAFRASAGLAPEVLRRLLLDHGIPRALHLRGFTLLHGSAVAGPGGALVFLGGSGAGKSTLAALLALLGMPLLADDAVRLEDRGGRVLVHPTHPRLRLRDPAAERLRASGIGLLPVVGERARWALDARRPPLRFGRRAVPLAGIYLLAPRKPGRRRRGPSPTIALGRRDALLALLDASFPADPWDMPAFLRDVARLSGSPALARVRRAHHFT